jgi:hypothetical protein
MPAGRMDDGALDTTAEDSAPTGKFCEPRTPGDGVVGREENCRDPPEHSGGRNVFVDDTDVPNMRAHRARRKGASSNAPARYALDAAQIRSQSGDSRGKTTP